MNAREFDVIQQTLHGRRAIENAAILAHEANRGYCEALGDTSQVAWADSPVWQQTSAIDGVTQIVNDPATTPAQSHESWLAGKKAAGWVYGETKDAEKKTHPCMVDYADLPPFQRHKDAIFGAVVREALYCYGRRALTNKSVKVPELNLWFSCPDADKTYGLIQALGRATRIAAQACLWYLDATGYVAPPDQNMSELSAHVRHALAASSPSQAYTWHRSYLWPQILIDFPALADVDRVRETNPLTAVAYERLRVQWHVVFYVTKAVLEIEGVDFQMRAGLETSTRWYNATERDHIEVKVITKLQNEACADIVREQDAKVTAILAAPETP